MHDRWNILKISNFLDNVTWHYQHRSSDGTVDCIYIFVCPNTYKEKLPSIYPWKLIVFCNHFVFLSQWKTIKNNRNSNNFFCSNVAILNLPYLDIWTDVFTYIRHDICDILYELLWAHFSEYIVDNLLDYFIDLQAKDIQKSFMILEVIECSCFSGADSDLSRFLDHKGYNWWIRTHKMYPSTCSHMQPPKLLPRIT